MEFGLQYKSYFCLIMEITPITKFNAGCRQHGKSAICGDVLNLLIVHTHHLYPDAYGFIDHVYNWVRLCKTCEWRVRNSGNYTNLILAPTNYFSYLNGKKKKRKYLSKTFLECYPQARKLI